MPVNESPVLVGIPLWVIQLAISTIGLMIGSIIATAGSIIAYKNAYGSAPLIMIAGHGLKGGGRETDPYWVMLEIEIWNNRKYPIRYNSLSISFDEIELLSTGGGKNEWHVWQNAVHWTKAPVKIGPSNHIAHSVEVPFKRRTIDDLSSNVRVLVNYFDPISNKSKVLRAKYTYSFIN